MNKVISFVVVLVVGVGIAIYRSNARESAEDRIEAQVNASIEKIMEVCRKTQNFNKYKDQFSDAAETAHDRAIDAAYSDGTRRRLPKFDPDRYAAAFAEQIVLHGKMGRTDRDLDLFLRQVQIDLEAAVKAGKFHFDVD